MHINLPKKGNKTNLLKKSFALILSGAVTIPLIVPGNTSVITDRSLIYAEADNVTYGDVNSDGKISILDMIALKSYITEKNSKEFSVKAADLDGDGTVSAKDAVELSMFLLNQTGSFSYEMNIDTDGDGLCDYVEKEILKTDYLKVDTDGDGLDDYSEVYLCNTNPLDTDTGKTGIKDSLKDEDGDKLTNAEEIKLGTSPVLPDSDEDGLSDYDEVNKHKTNPLNPDTDGDGIKDGSEVALSLSPLKSATDGTKDIERVFNKSYDYSDSKLETVNKDDSPYKISLELKANGDIEDNLSISASGYSSFLSSEFIEGEIIDIEYNQPFEIKEKTLRFEIENAESYWIFKYYPEISMLLPVETSYEKDTLYYKDSGEGTYCIVRYEEWLSQMSESTQKIAKTYNSSLDNYTYENAKSSDKSLNSNGIDLYFVIFTSMEYKDLVRDDIIAASKAILTNSHKSGNDDVRIYYFSYLGNAVPNSEKYYVDYTDYMKDNEIIENMVSRTGALNVNLSNENYAFYYTFIENDSYVSINNDSSETQTPFFPYVYINTGVSNKFKYNKQDEAIDSFSEIVQSEENANRSKYCIVVDYDFTPVLNWGKNTIQASYEMIGNFKEEYNVDFTFITNNGNKNYEYYDNMDSGKKYYYWTYNCVEQIVSDIIIPEQIGTTFNMKTGALKSTVFKKEPNSDWLRAANGEFSQEQLKEMLFADSDNDGLYDFEEIDWSLVSVDSNGNLVFPSLGELINKYGDCKGLIEKLNSILSLKVIPLKSDPDSKDSDEDGLYDFEARYVTVYDENGNYNQEKVAPVDPDPKNANAPAGIWDEHVRQLKEGTRVARSLTDNYDLEDGVKTAIGSVGLDFKLDDKGIAVHSKEKQWQKIGGYNDGYDTIFRTFTSNNMEALKIPYKAKYSGDDEEKEHIIWMWRGDYLNIGTGGEIGIYNDPAYMTLFYNGVPINGGYEWFVPEYRFGMTLEIYNYYGKNDIQNVLCWHPYEKQWWITGFNPEMRYTTNTGFKDPDVHDTILVGSVDFYDPISKEVQTDMFDSITEEISDSNELSKFIIPDKEDYKLWIVWWHYEE